jgi:hypothetical protein
MQAQGIAELFSANLSQQFDSEVGVRESKMRHTELALLSAMDP